MYILYIYGYPGVAGEWRSVCPHLGMKEIRSSVQLVRSLLGVCQSGAVAGAAGGLWVVMGFDEWFWVALARLLTLQQRAHMAAMVVQRNYLLTHALTYRILGSLSRACSLSSTR